MTDLISFGMSLPKDLLKKIDTERGDIPRTRFILRVLEKAYGGS